MQTVHPRLRAGASCARISLMAALVLTYHAVEKGPPPLCVDPGLFREHLDLIADSGVRAVTVRELADLLRAGLPPEPLVAIAFDDGFASVARTAAPLLLERGLRATVFCVAGRLGGRSDWPTARRAGFVGGLATASELAELSSQGFEIGSHGYEHAPLIAAGDPFLRRELVESRRVLEDASRSPVRTFAFPYGATPSPGARRLLEKTYDAACATALSRVEQGVDLFALPRVDVHYVRRAESLRRVLGGHLDAYLRARGLGARVRRAFTKDYVVEAVDG